MISYAQGFYTLLVVWTSLTSAFHTSSILRSRGYNRQTLTCMSDVDTDIDDISYSSLAVSGFISKANNFADAFVFQKLFKTGRWKDITTISDNTKFARKRMMSPGLVYSGLTDVLKFTEVDNTDSSLETALAGKEAWLSFNVTSAELPVLASIAAKVGVKRAVFAVNVELGESGEGVTFESSVATLAAANVDYTIIKYGNVRKMAEAKYPYKIVRGALSLPVEGGILSSEDLMRVSYTSNICMLSSLCLSKVILNLLRHF